MTLYCAGRWTASKNDPSSEFFAGGRDCSGGGRGSDGGQDNGRLGGGGWGNRRAENNCWRLLTCHKCGKLEYIERNCWTPVVVPRTVWETVREPLWEQTLAQGTLMPVQTFQQLMMQLYVDYRVGTKLDSKLF